MVIFFSRETVNGYIAMNRELPVFQAEDNAQFNNSSTRNDKAFIGLFYTTDV